MSVLCAHCGGDFSENAANCPHCGAQPGVSTLPAGQDDGLPAAPASLAVSAESASSADRELTGIGGWLILPMIGLAITPIQNLAGIARCVMLFFNPRVSDYLQAHTGLHLLIQFEAVTNSVFLIYSIVLNVLFYGQRKSFPMAMVAFLAMNPVIVAIDHMGVLRIGQHGSPIELLRALVAAAIWIPYFLRSRRVELTFTR